MKGAFLFIKSHAPQIFWNFKTMQGSSLYWILSGYGTATLLEKLKNHFNSHPYFTQMFAGALARIDENKEYEKIEKIVSLSSAFAAIGDRLFWSIIKPLASMTGILLLYKTDDIVFSGFISLILYNALSYPLRLYFFYSAFKNGVEFIDEVLFKVKIEFISKLLNILLFIVSVAVILSILKSNLFLIILLPLFIFLNYKKISEIMSYIVVLTATIIIKNI